MKDYFGRADRLVSQSLARIHNKTVADKAERKRKEKGYDASAQATNRVLDGDIHDGIRVYTNPKCTIHSAPRISFSH